MSDAATKPAPPKEKPFIHGEYALYVDEEKKPTKKQIRARQERDYAEVVRQHTLRDTGEPMPPPPWENQKVQRAEA